MAVGNPNAAVTTAAVSTGTTTVTAATISGTGTIPRATTTAATTPGAAAGVGTPASTGGATFTPATTAGGSGPTTTAGAPPSGGGGASTSVGPSPGGATYVPPVVSHPSAWAYYFGGAGHPAVAGGGMAAGGVPATGANPPLFSSGAAPGMGHPGTASATGVPLGPGLGAGVPPAYGAAGTPLPGWPPYATYSIGPGVPPLFSGPGMGPFGGPSTTSGGTPVGPSPLPPVGGGAGAGGPGPAPAGATATGGVGTAGRSATPTGVPSSPAGAGTPPLAGAAAGSAGASVPPMAGTSGVPPGAAAAPPGAPPGAAVPPVVNPGAPGPGPGPGPPPQMPPWYPFHFPTFTTTLPDAKSHTRVRPFKSSDPIEWTTWREHFETVARINRWEAERACLEAKAAMEDIAARKVKDVSLQRGPPDPRDPYQMPTWNLQSLLRTYESRFVTKEAGRIAEAKFLEASRSSGEDILAYHARLRDLFLRAFPGVVAETSAQLRSQFIRGLRSPAIMEYMSERDPTTYTECLAMAEQKQAGITMIKHFKKESGGINLLADSEDDDPRGEEEVNTLRKDQSSGQRGQTDATCWHCGKVGHFKLDCYLWKRQAGRAPARGRGPGQRPNRSTGPASRGRGRAAPPSAGTQRSLGTGRGRRPGRGGRPGTGGKKGQPRKDVTTAKKLAAMGQEQEEGERDGYEEWSEGDAEEENY